VHEEQKTSKFSQENIKKENPKSQRFEIISIQPHLKD
jgi:hypothetical protein